MFIAKTGEKWLQISEAENSNAHYHYPGRLFYKLGKAFKSFNFCELSLEIKRLNGNTFLGQNKFFCKLLPVNWWEKLSIVLSKLLETLIRTKSNGTLKQINFWNCARKSKRKFEIESDSCTIFDQCKPSFFPPTTIRAQLILLWK